MTTNCVIIHDIVWTLDSAVARKINRHCNYCTAALCVKLLRVIMFICIAVVANDAAPPLFSFISELSNFIQNGSRKTRCMGLVVIQCCSRYLD